jgi:hypothetical protein
MNDLIKLLKLPSPVDLGWSTHNTLGFRNHGAQPGQKTWQDYYEYLRATYPVRGLIATTLNDALHNAWWSITRPIRDVRYYLVSHLIPSRRYHMLDLRQPNGYRYGWNDFDNRLKYAMFNLLNQFVERELPNICCPTEEEAITETYLATQRNAYLEAVAIHNWWSVERPAAYKSINDLLVKTYGNGVPKLNDCRDDVDALQKMEDDLDAKETEMMMRLIKVRKSLWT